MIFCRFNGFNKNMRIVNLMTGQYEEVQVEIEKVLLETLKDPKVMNSKTNNKSLGIYVHKHKILETNDNEIK